MDRRVTLLERVPAIVDRDWLISSAGISEDWIDGDNLSDTHIDEVLVVGFSVFVRSNAITEHAVFSDWIPLDAVDVDEELLLLGFVEAATGRRHGKLTICPTYLHWMGDWVATDGVWWHDGGMIALCQHDPADGQMIKPCDVDWAKAGSSQLESMLAHVNESLDDATATLISDHSAA